MYLILKNESKTDHLLWEKACDEMGYEHKTIDISRNDWLDRIQAEKFDLILSRPPGLVSRFKQLYDERLYILNQVLGYNVYPSYIECALYENKRLLASFLQAKKIPHPQTYVFYHKDEALSFLEQTKYPVVGKINIGASGNGVEIFQSKIDAMAYVERAFSDKGLANKTGTKLTKKGVFFKRVIKLLKNPSHYTQRIKVYNSIKADSQKGFVLFQEYIEHSFEWRCVRIGDSFFAHKKVKVNEKASGTLLKEYGAPPKELLDFIFELTERNNLKSVAVDIFSGDDIFYVNEIQVFFGQSDPHQMIVDGSPGKYIRKNQEWIFVEGKFCDNACFNERIRDIEKKSLIKLGVNIE